MERRSALSTCHICEATCGVVVETRGREVVGVRGDEADGFSRGHVCPKVMGLRDLQHDPDRLRGPVRRTPSGFEPISWDEAWDFAAAGLERVRSAGGADAVALYRGNPGIHDFATLLGANVIGRALGSKNVFSAGSVDTWPRYVQSTEMYGGPLRATVPDVDRTDLLFVVGANPLVSNGSMMTAPGIGDRLAALQARGGRLIVLDPRRSETARRAHEHHFVSPGSDAALLLAMVHVLFAEGRVSLGAWADRVDGLGELERATSAFTPERVAPRCGVAPDTIRRLARELADAPSAATYGRMGTCVQRFGTLASWAIDLLAVLTGNLDRPGGSMFTNPAAPLHFVFEGDGPVRFGRWRSRVSGSDEILGEFPAPVLAEEIETPGDGRVRGLVTIAGNPVRSYPNTARIERAIASLEFMVSLDYYVNETTRHADVILPPTGPLERPHYDLALNHFAVRNVAKWSDPVLEPEAGGRSAWVTALELGRRLMGIEALTTSQVDDFVLSSFAGRALAASRFSDRLDLDRVLRAVAEEPGPQRILDVLLRLGPHGDGCGLEADGLSLDRVRAEPHGLDLGALAPMGPGHVVRDGGRIQLAPRRLLDDLPRLEAWLERPPSAALRLINRRDVRSMNSWLHNLPSLARGRDRCTLQIHPEDAAARGLADGEEARVSADVGELRVRVEVTEDVMPGVVSLPHGFGHAGEGISLRVAGRRPGVNVNDVTDDAPLDVPSGASVLFGLEVGVEKAVEKAATDDRAPTVQPARRGAASAG